MRLAFTTLYGGYDKPVPQPREDGIRYVGFSDILELPYPWERTDIDGTFKNNYYKSRYIWHNVHKVCEYDQSILLSGGTLVKCDLNKFINDHHRGDLTVLRHEWYPDIKEEAKAVIRNKQAPPEEIKAAYTYIVEQGFPLSFGLFALNLVIRENNKRVNKFFEILSDHVQNTCHRDQIFFPYVWWKYNRLLNLDINIIEDNVYDLGLFKNYNHE